MAPSDNIDSSENFEYLFDSFIKGKVSREVLLSCELLYECKACKTAYRKLIEYCEHYDYCKQNFTSIKIIPNQIVNETEPNIIIVTEGNCLSFEMNTQNKEDAGSRSSASNPHTVNVAIAPKNTKNEDNEAKNILILRDSYMRAWLKEMNGLINYDVAMKKAEEYALCVGIDKLDKDWRLKCWKQNKIIPHCMFDKAMKNWFKEASRNDKLITYDVIMRKVEECASKYVISKLDDNWLLNFWKHMLNQHVWQWYQGETMFMNSGLFKTNTVSSHDILRKAQIFANKLNLFKFNADRKWLNDFCLTHNIPEYIDTHLLQQDSLITETQLKYQNLRLSCDINSDLDSWLETVYNFDEEKCVRHEELCKYIYFWNETSINSGVNISKTDLIDRVQYHAKNELSIDKSDFLWLQGFFKSYSTYFEFLKLYKLAEQKEPATIISNGGNSGLRQNVYYLVEFSFRPFLQREQNCIRYSIKNEPLTICFCFSALGKKETPILISKNLLCVSGLNFFIDDTTKSYLDTWLIGFNKKMRTLNENVTLVIGNSPRYRILNRKYSNVKIKFLPAVKIFHHKIFSYFKIFYMNSVIRELLGNQQRFEKQDFVQLEVHSVCKLIKYAWGKISECVIKPVLHTSENSDAHSLSNESEALLVDALKAEAFDLCEKSNVDVTYLTNWLQFEKSVADVEKCGIYAHNVNDVQKDNDEICNLVVEEQRSFTIQESIVAVVKIIETFKTFHGKKFDNSSIFEKLDFLRSVLEKSYVYIKK